MLAKFFAELNKLAELATFTVIPFDHEVFEEKVYVWKKGQNQTWERVLCGGTSFAPPTEYVNKHHFEGHIILTDGYADTPPTSKPRRMWLIPESCKDNQPWTNNEIKVWVKDC
jgi:predicted metal-dependent peptidase